MTFVTELIWGKVRVAKFKLDWIFVWTWIARGTRRDRTCFFTRTFTDLNNCLPEPISDHSPMTVDLPFYDVGKSGGEHKAAGSAVGSSWIVTIDSVAAPIRGR